MTRIIAVVEGQTEAEFINKVLQNHLSPHNIFISSILVSTKKKKSTTLARGGISKYHLAKKDILSSLHQGDNPYVTTMFDYYGLPKSYPGKNNLPAGNCYEKVVHLETQLANDINNSKFIPYLQLHEFEAILFSSPQEICNTLVNNDKLEQLEAINNSFQNPEEINDNPNTCPAKRLKDLFEDYNKVVHGGLISQRIRLAIIREACPHFNEWLTKLENPVRYLVN